jgi:hypothetical protein
MPPVKPGAKYTNKIGTGAQSLILDTAPVAITVVVAATVQNLTSLEFEFAFTIALSTGIAIAIDAPSNSKLRISALENAM